MSKKPKSPSKSNFFADFGVPNALPAAPVQAAKPPAKPSEEQSKTPVVSPETSSGEDLSSLAADEKKKSSRTKNP